MALAVWNAVPQPSPGSQKNRPRGRARQTRPLDSGRPGLLPRPKWGRPGPSSCQRAPARASAPKGRTSRRGQASRKQSNEDLTDSEIYGDDDGDARGKCGKKNRHEGACHLVLAASAHGETWGVSAPRSSLFVPRSGSLIRGTNHPFRGTSHPFPGAVQVLPGTIACSAEQRARSVEWPARSAEQVARMAERKETRGVEHASYHPDDLTPPMARPISLLTWSTRPG